MEDQSHQYCSESEINSFYCTSYKFISVAIFIWKSRIKYYARLNLKVQTTYLLRQLFNTYKSIKNISIKLADLQMENNHATSFTFKSAITTLFVTR